MKSAQCPNCHQFKIINLSSKAYFMAFTEFLFGTLLLPLFLTGLALWVCGAVTLARAPMLRGKVRCKRCHWEGKRADLSIAR